MSPQVTPRLKGAKKKRGGPARDKAVATDLHSKIIRAAGECQNCGYVCPCPEKPVKHLQKPGCKLECAHIITRARRNTRTDLDGAFCLCASCHTHFTLNPVEWGIWVIDQIGRRAYNDHYRKSLEPAEQTALMFWRGERARLQQVWDEIRSVAA